MKHAFSSQRGIALIQVLLLSVLLSVILMSMNYQARQHIRLAEAVQQYTAAAMALQSAEAEILFSMLSQQPYQLEQGILAEAPDWNFYGTPFMFHGVELTIHDTSGLLNAAMPNEALLARFTEQHAGSQALGNQIAAALADWQDRDNTPRLDGAEQPDYSNVTVRNGPLQYTEELLFIKGVTPQLYAQLAPLLSFFTQGVNVNQQPETLWRLYLPENQVQELSRLRRSGTLTAELFESLTAMSIDEFSRFSFGPAYRIGFTVKNADVRLSRELTLRFMPYQRQPFDIYEYRLRNTPTDMLNAASND
ncbi:general secretion pathway protein GspK [Arsukibacterium indicum]|uniref:General secretion pathway protein GspK n=1 Tax=Arsukibacterium indicum TaxID=2848612 RepID=A0ABS6MHU4_9GAMM|nr:type II secretion system protein GspK [Arsukibacterium indicum]MBV2127787.1 general secretion pathway protein GspK [Arsukibacterium indicum]